MAKRVKLSDLADHIVAHTPPLSFSDRSQFWCCIQRRNYARLRGSFKALDILCEMVEKRLIARDGAVFSARWRANDAVGVPAEYRRPDLDRLFHRS